MLTADIDYVELINHTVTLNSSYQSATVNIVILTNDTELEQDEHFIVNLSFPGEPIRGVILDPNKTTVEIVEFDGAGRYHACTKIILVFYDAVMFISCTVCSWVLFT